MITNKNDNYNELKDVLRTYLPEAEIEVIEKAYEFASKKHDGQFRKTGEEYINHPVLVALILTTVFADYETIVAALLHDVLEDTSSTKEELTMEFSQTIANLVDGVTKINNINVSTENEYLTNYYKKIIVGMSEDVRVIIIKLADRLHNMRTLYAIPIEKQKIKAKETLEILAPIAHRLGMHKIKSELEDLSLRYLKPDVYFDIVERLNNTKIEREEYVDKMMSEVSNLLTQNDIKFEIKGRAKSIYSIYKKLDKGKSFSDIYDLLAIRILVEEEQECYAVLGLIHSKYRPLSKRFKDYIAMPKTNLYQTLHTTIFGYDGYLFEIQIRTYSMDEIAENGIASHWAYKENKNAAVEMQNITEQKLQFYKSIIELNEKEITNEDFVNRVKDEVLNDNIYVYTPKGDVIELPKASTPIDFAYKVHSQIGDKMTGAIVNDLIVPLSYELKNADIIRIITNNNSTGPSHEWLAMAKTTQAKNKIKAFFNKTTREDYIESGKDILEKELRRKKISISDFLKQDNLNTIFKEFKVDSIEDLYLNIGNNKFSTKSIIKQENEETLEQTKEIKVFNRVKNSDNDIIVGDTDNIQTHIASCCFPIPGDEIVGYITKSNGISIHRRTCQNIANEDERMVSAIWNPKIKNKYYTELVVYTNTKNNIMIDLVQNASVLSIMVESVNLINKSDSNVFSILLLVKNTDDLNNYMKSLLKIKSIVDIERIVK